MKIGTKGVASNIGEKVQQTGETIADGGKTAVNTTVETSGKIAHSAWDGTRNLAAAGVEKTEQAWQGTNDCEFVVVLAGGELGKSHLVIEHLNGSQF